MLQFNGMLFIFCNKILLDNRVKQYTSDSSTKSLQLLKTISGNWLRPLYVIAELETTKRLLLECNLLR